MENGVRSFWKAAEPVFIDIWANYEEELRCPRKNSHVYAVMADEMAEKGFEIDAFQVKTKIKNLRRKFRHEKDLIGCSGGTRSKWTYFERISEIIGSQLTMNLESLMEDNIPNDLELLGATAVEDALQDDVDETLLALQQAGIKVWVLTGDKVETAFNIGLACKHISKDSSKYFIVDCTEKEALLEHLNEVKKQLENEKSQDFALIIDGKGLSKALEEASEIFRQVALQCKAVLCSRLSPLQKSEVVALIKKSKEKFITAAVGDGANDVSMIQEAHVGIGIMGKEGRQAARCADYAIAKFCMLRKLFLVHGQYNTARLSFLVLFYCYKNIVHTACMFLFQFYNLYSSTTVFHGLYMWLFDVIYLIFSFTFVAMSEKPFFEYLLMRDPSLYKRNHHNKQVSWQVFFRWMLNGAYHGLVIFYFAYLIFSTNDVILNGGQTAEFYGFSSVLIQLVITVGNLKLFLISNYITVILITLVGLSFMGFILTTVLYNIILINGVNSLYNVYNYLYISPILWLYTLVTAVACLLPDLLIKTVQRSLEKSIFK